VNLRTLPILAALLALPLAAGAQLYRWVDAEGVVNYGDAPPSDAKNVRAVGPASLSVVPGVSKEQMEAMRERDEQRRQQRLQQDAEDARIAAAAKPATGVLPDFQTYESVGYDYGYGPAYDYGPPRVRPPYRPRPRPPVVNPTAPANPMQLGEPSILRGR
jgi:hypothetical protein